MQTPVKKISGQIYPLVSAEFETIPDQATAMLVYKPQRDPIKHRRMMSLFNFYWSSFEPPEVEHNGKPLKMSFDAFRHDVMRQMGYYKPIINLDQTIELKPDSIAFDKCSDRKAERIYSDLLDWGAQWLFNGNFSSEELERLSNEWLRYN